MLRFFQDLDRQHAVRQRTRPTLSNKVSTNSLVFNEDEFLKKKYPPLLRSSTWFIIFFSYIIVFLFVLYSDFINFPSPLSVESLQTSKNRGFEFSEERARNFVIELSNIGPKPTGSYENEVLAVEYITRTLNFIKSHTKPVNKIDIDLQKPSGCFDLTFRDGMTSCYDKVKNIAAKIGPVKKTSNHSIIINCHFDSVPTSPGASDDIVSCAVMLEILISFSQHDQPLPHEVIFLFNGAEENILQAAHGFITQHRWAKTAVGFINLEACGAGGKQMLFQADRERTWLLLSYTSGTPFPQGSVIAQDIFQNGLIPSDTDYRIFDHFGEIPGLDFAYVKNGYVYHTKFDVPDAITKGAIQQAGMNLLNLLHNALNHPDMRSIQHQTKQHLVFFDFMGVTMVVYRVWVATGVNSLVLVASLADIYFKCYKSGLGFEKRFTQVLKALGVLVGSIFAAYAFCAVIAIFLDVLGSTMSWYGSPYLVVGLYGCSSLAAIIFIHHLTVGKEQNLRERWLQEDVFFDAARLFWMMALLALEKFRINSSFLCCAWVLFPTLVRGGLARQWVGERGTARSHVAVHLCMQIVPVSLLVYCVWSMYTVFIPIMGRIGASVNPDLLVGLFTTLVVFWSTSYMVSLIHVMEPPRQVISLLLYNVAVVVALVCLTPLGFPYSGDPDSPAPMRVYILHTGRTFFNRSGAATRSDSGYWVVPLDYNGPELLPTFLEEMQGIEPIDCDAELACGMPFYMPVISLLGTSYYVHAPKPKIDQKHRFTLTGRSLIDPHTYRLTFETDGPDHVTILLSPRRGVDMVRWSLSDGPPLRSLDWGDRPTYFVYYSYGEHPNSSFTFSVDLSVTKEHARNAPLLDLSYITHYLHGHNMITSDFPRILDKFPDWVHATPWTCTLDMFEF